MKRHLLFIILLAYHVSSSAQLISLEDDLLFGIPFESSFLETKETPKISMSRARQIRRNDIYRAFIPGAVQMRRQWPTVAGSIWGGMAISGGLVAYEHFHIVKLQHNMDNDASNVNWYDGKIRQSKKIRNGSLYALGGIYIANYVTALLLPDRDPRTSWISFYADPQGTVGLYLALTL